MNTQLRNVGFACRPGSGRARSGAWFMALVLAQVCGVLADAALAQVPAGSPAASATAPPPLPASATTPATASSPASAHPVVAQARKGSSGYTVDASFTVAASHDLVWDVLTDFDRMAQILSSVDASKIVNRKDNEFDVEQESHATAGPLRASLLNVRRVTLVPKTEIRSRLVSSDSLKASDFTTRITPHGDLMKVDVRGTFVPSFLAGAVLSTENIEASVGKQYTELRDEILRRKNGQPRPACLAKKNCP